ncbi:MAG: tail fiber protein [Pseudomonadota bacterium]|nr:tail fiber protein [Pseudomonadota bacterium]
MAVHDYVIANDSAANVRADINNALAAIRSSNLSPTEPANKFAGLFWFDTTNDELKFRNEANDGWIVLGKFQNNANVAATPSGAILQFAGSTAPDGWLICNGQTVSRTTYANLFAAISTTYGAGNGSTTFSIPDLRGRVPVGAGQGAGLTNRVLAATGGQQSAALSESQIPTHHHLLVADVVSSTNGASGDLTSSNQIKRGGQHELTTFNQEAYHLGGVSTAATIGRSSNVGSSSAVSRMQPFMVLNHIIKV